MTLIQLDDHQWIVPGRVIAIREVAEPGAIVTLITLDVQGGPYPLRTSTRAVRVIELIQEAWRAADGA